MTTTTTMMTYLIHWDAWALIRTCSLCFSLFLCRANIGHYLHFFANVSRASICCHWRFAYYISWVPFRNCCARLFLIGTRELCYFVIYVWKIFKEWLKEWGVSPCACGFLCERKCLSFGKFVIMLLQSFWSLVWYGLYYKSFEFYDIHFICWIL